MREKLSEAGVIGKYVLLVPGTRGENKKWPIKYWGELAKRLAKKGIFCIISGTVGEKSMADEIRRIAQSKYVVDFIGKTNLLELIALERWLLSMYHRTQDRSILPMLLELLLLRYLAPHFLIGAVPMEIVIVRFFWRRPLAMKLQIWVQFQ